jgi:hypothetical protein
MTIEGPRRIPMSRREICSFMAGLYVITGASVQARCELDKLTGEVMDHPPQGGN